MKPDGLETLIINKIDGLVTNADAIEQASNFARKFRGFRNTRLGMIGERDFGTKHRFAAYPTINLTPSTITIIDGFTLYDPEEAKEREIVIGLDKNNDMRIYIYDDVAAIWEEITRKITADINQVITAGSTGSLYSVSFTATTTGTAVGVDGLILRTTDSGSTWNAQTSGTTDWLYGVFMFDVNEGWAVGDNGTILHTVNGGTTWAAQTSTVTVQLRSVHFVSATVGWAVGASGTIVATTDGGTTWATQTSTTTNPLFGVHFASTTVGWAVGAAGKILGTTDGGTTWAAQTSGTTNVLLGVSSISTAVVNAVGDNGTILGTTNGGTNWNAQSSGTAEQLRSVVLISTTVGVAVGLGGVIVRSSSLSDGAGWVIQTSGTTQTLLGVDHPSSAIGYAVGNNATIVGTTDSGVTWSSQLSVGVSTVNLDNIQENSTTPLSPVLAADDLKNWIAVNDSQTKTAKSVIGVLDNGLGAVRLNILSHGFATGDVLFVRDVTGNNSGRVNGYWEITDADTDNIDLQGSTFAGVTYSGGGTVEMLPSVALITTNTTSQITVLNVVDPTGLNWKDNDNLSFYRTTAGYNGFVKANGTTPHIRWNPVEAQRKVNLYHGNSATPPAMNLPISIKNKSANSLFFDSSGTAQLTLDANWFMEFGGGGLTPFYKTYGTSQEPITPTIGVQRAFISEIDETDPWLMFEFKVQDAASLISNIRLVIMYATVEYYGYEESDPILRIVAIGSSASVSPAIVGETTPRSVPRVIINPAKMPKGVTAINFYRADVTVAVFDAGGHHNVASSDFLHVEQIKLNEDQTALSNFPSSSRFGRFWEPGILTDRGGMIFSAKLEGSGTPTATTNTGTVEDIASRLGHEPDLNRSYLRPRFAARAARSQGAVIAVDEDNNTLRLSSYSGAGAHMDDSFPDVSVDINNNNQQLLLNGRGELLGLEILSSQSPFFSERSGKLLAFKTSEIEMFDIKTSEYLLFGADVVALKSIFQTPLGTVWAGKSALWILPLTGADIKELNTDWKNLYDGALMASDGTTPIMTDAFRSAIITGYDPTYGQILFFTQLNDEDTPASTEYITFRVHKERDRFKWNKRKFNIGADDRIRYFSSRNDRTLTIGYDSGILLYPNTTGAFPYEDDVTSADASANKGIETKIRFSLGELHRLDKRAVLDHLRLRQEGVSVNGNNLVNVKFYVPGITTAIDEQWFPIDDLTALLRLDSSWGQLHGLEIELSLPTPTNFKKWDISTMELGYIPQETVGNI